MVSGNKSPGKFVLLIKSVSKAIKSEAKEQ